MDIDDVEEDHEGTSFSTHSLHNHPFSFPRKSRSRDPQFSPRNPNFHGPEPGDSDEISGGCFSAVPSKKRRSSSASKSEENWSERAIFALLEIWGERFLELRRRSLRSEDWRDVAERVSEVSRVEKSEVQCRSMLDSLKRKYKKEKDRLGGCPSNWGYFRKMEALFGGSAGWGLNCGVDSGEFVFADMNVYLEQANGFDEMRDSPADSEASSEDDVEGTSGNGSVDGGSMRVLAESIERLGEIYGKIESDKKRQMVELECMRRDLNRDLESQKRLIVERAHAEIARIRGDDEDDEDEDEDEEDDLSE